MNNFPQPQIDNIGGLATFRFTEVESVISIARPTDHKITSSVQLKVGKLWYTGYASVDSLKYSEESNQDDNGHFIKATLKGFVPESPEMLQLLVQMDGRRFIVHLTDNDALEKIAGTKEQPLTFNCDFETQTVSGIKGYNYQFTGILEKRAPIYELNSGSSSGSTA